MNVEEERERGGFGEKEETDPASYLLIVPI